MSQNIKQKAKKQKRERKLKKPKNIINPSGGQQPSINVLERENRSGQRRYTREERRPFHKTEGYLEFSDLKCPLISW